MAGRLAKASDANQIVICINNFWDYLKARGQLPNNNVVTVNDLLLWQDQGYRAWVWTDIGTRVVAVCIFRLETVVPPDSDIEEQWMVVPHLVVRPAVLTTTALREKHLMRILGPAIIEGAETLGAKGVMCVFPSAMVELSNWLTRWPRITETVAGDQTRFWARLSPGLPLIRQAIIDAG